MSIVLPVVRSACFPALRSAALCVALALHPCASAAQVEVVIDNDLFGLRGADDPPPDHDYTHGTAVSWEGRGGARWEIGQRIYTPRHDAPRPVAGERPYAGWLYGAWERIRITAGSRSALRVEAGVTGRPSLAEPVQNGLHRLAGYQRQEGWAHQLPFEPGAVVSYAREHRALAFGATGGTRLEVLPAWSLRAGSVRTGAEAGVRARLGWGAGEVWTGRGAARRLSGWIEAGARQEAVLRDLFLDGSTFAQSARVDRRTWVAQGEAAFGVRWRRTELEYRFVLRGRDYETQEKPHPWGSVRVRWYR